MTREQHAFRTMERRSTTRDACTARRGLGLVVLWANSRRAPPHAVGRASTAPTAPPISSGGFERLPFVPTTPVARVPRAYCAMEYRPTVRGARAARPADFAHDCGAGGQRAAHSFPRRRPSHDRSECVSGRRWGHRKVFVRSFESHDARTARISHYEEWVDDARSTHRARRGLGLGVL